MLQVPIPTTNNTRDENLRSYIYIVYHLNLETEHLIPKYYVQSVPHIRRHIYDELVLKSNSDKEHTPTVGLCIRTVDHVGKSRHIKN